MQLFLELNSLHTIENLNQKTVKLLNQQLQVIVQHNHQEFNEHYNLPYKC